MTDQVGLTNSIMSDSILSTLPGSEPIRVGIVGYGYSAKTFHIPLLTSNENFKFTSISSSQKETLESKYPDLVVFNSPEALIKDSNVQLIVITAPNAVHFSLAKLALENGKHVVLEKPMCNTLTEAMELVTYSTSQGLLLSTFHNRRWDGDFLTVKSVIDANKLGDVRVFESRMDRFRPVVRDRWRENPGPGSGIFYDLGSHLLDQALTLFGVPTSVSGTSVALRPGGSTVDFFDVHLHYEDSKVEVILHSGPYFAGCNPRFTVCGEKGTYVKFGVDVQEDQLKQGITPADADYGVESKVASAAKSGGLYTPPGESEVETLDGRYQAYFENIAGVLHGESGCESHVQGAQVVWVLFLLELCQASCDKGVRLTVKDSSAGLPEYPMPSK
ncbi:hypothetical protein SARC_11461 [Sphaeroforma arctica JP610]|uniref:Oxidoreductase n=1 Tax=Sphaeroforma arctica JP610 TaxID=667725 RepID=A0A0L0FGY1_9EUKA|nr:hypothetical protein SARC_11461 [Sphaeroforma arctica JP610]KNC76027.1 hypothetical protein SARC_11461 [Sphaeroforma arctica JP610]|eukprot:XP_014149929.1 hypothetical protein SARC_11461 [Sphaeroforma arctica JP610]